MTEEGDDFPITDAEEYLHQPAFDGLGECVAMETIVIFFWVR